MFAFHPHGPLVGGREESAARRFPQSSDRCSVKQLPSTRTEDYRRRFRDHGPGGHAGSRPNAMSDLTNYLVSAVHEVLVARQHAGVVNEQPGLPAAALRREHGCAGRDEHRVGMLISAR